jgi:hypothetical protein
VGSSWTEDACPRRWYFRRGLGLKPRYKERAPRYGDAWHAVVAEDIYAHWRDTDGAPYLLTYASQCRSCLGVGGACATCGGTGDGPVRRFAHQWIGTDAEEDIETLDNAVAGWLIRWGNQPAPGWRVLGVEIPLSFPIPSPDSATGRTYEPLVYVTTSPAGLQRLARAGEAVPGALPDGWRCELQRVPAHVSVRLDVAMVGPNHTVWVNELKSSADAPRYLSGLSVDPQVTIYELALDYACSQGALWLPGPGRRGWADMFGADAPAPRSGGWLYDVASSRRQRDPQELKSGELSVAAQSLGSVPPWRLVAELTRRKLRLTDAAGKHNGAPVTWAWRLSEAVRRQDRWYVRDTGASPPDLRAEVLAELFGVASRRADWYRSSALLRTEVDVRRKFMRVPVCRTSGCAYRTPCFADGPDARQWFDLPTDLDEVVPTDTAPDDWTIPSE